MSGWTQDRVDVLTRMWNGGEPSSEIAEALNTTRNGVIGKANRIGLLPRTRSEIRVKSAHAWTDADIEALRSLHDVNAPTAIIADKLRRSESAIRRAFFKLGLKRPKHFLVTRKPLPASIRAPDDAPRPKPGPARRDVDQEQPGPNAVTLAELRPKHCRWPVAGDALDPGMLYCGAISPLDKPYCSAHAERAYGERKPLSNRFIERVAA